MKKSFLFSVIFCFLLFFGSCDEPIVSSSDYPFVLIDNVVKNDDYIKITVNVGYTGNQEIFSHGYRLEGVKYGHSFNKLVLIEEVSLGKLGKNEDSFKVKIPIRYNYSEYKVRAFARTEDYKSLTNKKVIKLY